MSDSINKSLVNNKIDSVQGGINIADFILNIKLETETQLENLKYLLNQVSEKPQKINTIDVDGNNNIIIQDTNNTTINIKDYLESLSDKAIEKIFYKFYNSNFEKTNFKKNIIYILLLVSDRQSIERLYENEAIKDKINFEDYGSNYFQWKPYNNELSIAELLAQYKIFSGYNIEYINSDKAIEDKDDLLNVINKIIFVVDPLSIHNNFEQITQLIDNQSITPPLLIPICKDKHSDLKIFMRTIVSQKLTRYSSLYKKTKYLHQEYAHIELELPNKYDFFRKLTNIAKLKLKIENNIHIEDERLKKLQDSSISSFNL